MVVPAPEEDVGVEEVTPSLTEDNDSGESYEALPDDTPVSAGDVEVLSGLLMPMRHSQGGASDAIRLDTISETRCVRCMILIFET